MLAGSYCPPALHILREYLLQHANEEKSHWEWVISDLKNTGYDGFPLLDFERSSFLAKRC